MHSTYTHIELPAKRKAIRQLESWVNQQQEELKKQENKQCQHRNRPNRNRPRQPQARKGRKPWKKKTPVEVVMEQADKLKAEIAEAEEELKAKRRQLEKFEQAKKLFEGV